ncbi:MAG: DUF6266 family protein [Bacteroidia bacterium]
MAKITKGILGPISGKIGPVIGSSWKGIHYLKTAPTVKTDREPSPAQKAHHQKFKFLTQWLRPLHPFLMVGFKNLAIKTTEINAAFSKNFQIALNCTNGDLSIDYERVLISWGRLTGLHNPSMELANETTLNLSWQSNSGPYCAHDDQLMLVIYNDDLDIAEGFTGGVKRSLKSYSFTIPNKLVGKFFHVYVCMVALNGSEVSTSQYLGKIEPL